ncbi:hypothetical protein MKW92_042860 [Papaver armeniacum]|nr:hypothetical protein MKW92_042860 [Papaver armeniacum]
MGRLKIEIEKINDPKKRIVTFSKRRGGIKSKAAELCKLFPDINVCIIVFSPGGRAFTFTNSPLGVCNMVEQFLKEETKDKKQENKNVDSHKGKNSTTHVHESRDKAGVGSTDSFWWDNIDVEELDSAEKLKSVRQSLAKLKQNLSARKEELIASSLSSSSLSSSSTTNEDSMIVEDSDDEDCKIVEDAATSITEKHDDAGKTCSTDHPNLDLNLGW